jgi:hypothetical protein
MAGFNLPTVKSGSDENKDFVTSAWLLEYNTLIGAAEKVPLGEGHVSVLLSTVLARVSVALPKRQRKEEVDKEDLKPDPDIVRVVPDVVATIGDTEDTEMGGITVISANEVVNLSPPSMDA